VPSSRHEYDAQSRDIIDDITNRRALGIFLLDTNPLNRLVLEIFNMIKVADRETRTPQDD